MSAEWKPIIQECRNHVPIEGVNHLRSWRSRTRITFAL